MVPSDGPGTWHFVSVPSPVALLPGTYLIGALLSSVDVFDGGSNLSNGLTTAPQVHWVEERDANPPDFGGPFTAPTFSSNGTFGGAFGPNFEFTTPEPSTFVLMTLAVFSPSSLQEKRMPEPD